jgi:putative endonuclease
VPYYVYLLASRRHGTLYLGVTNDVVRRVYEHKNKLLPGFSAKYGIDRLVWYETYADVIEAIRREKEVKKWRRDWKIALIEADNPDWQDLFHAIAV